MTSGRPFRFGLIGGRWGVNYLRTVAGYPGWEIPIVARLHSTPLPDPFDHIPVTTDWRSLADPSLALNGVIIVTPPALHIEMAGHFVRHRIPVLVEKPLCLSAIDAQQLLQQTADFKTIAWVDHTHLFHPAFRALKELIKSQRILTITSHAGNMGPFRKDTPMFWDWMPHDLAMILDVAGESPAGYSARETERKNLPEGLGISTEMKMTFPSGLQTVTRLSNMVAPKCRWLTVQTDEMTLRYNGLGPDFLCQLPEGVPADQLGSAPGVVITTPAKQPLNVLMEEFAEAISHRDTSNQSLKLGTQVVELLESAWPFISGTS